ASFSTSVQDHTIFRPRLPLNDILSMSATAFESYCVINDGKGYRGPVRVRGHFATSKEVYEANRRRPLPKMPFQLATQSHKRASMSVPKSRPDAAIVAVLKELIQKKIDAENGKPS